MSGDRPKPSLAEEAAAWVPPWARQAQLAAEETDAPGAGDASDAEAPAADAPPAATGPDKAPTVNAEVAGPGGNAYVWQAEAADGPPEHFYGSENDGPRLAVSVNAGVAGLSGGADVSRSEAPAADAPLAATGPDAPPAVDAGVAGPDGGADEWQAEPAQSDMSLAGALGADDAGADDAPEAAPHVDAQPLAAAPDAEDAQSGAAAQSATVGVDAQAASSAAAEAVAVGEALAAESILDPNQGDQDQGDQDQSEQNQGDQNQGEQNTLDPAQLRGALEAILLVVDEPVSDATLAEAVQQPLELVTATVEALAAEYEAEGRGFELRRAAGGWRLYTRPEFALYVERFVLDGQQVRLTQASLETLAVVAYKQPVTRSRISAIRGVNCDGVIRTLVSRGLIEECGTEPETGALLYRTTSLFLEKLGMNSVAELPPLAPFLPDDVDEIADAPPG